MKNTLHIRSRKPGRAMSDDFAKPYPPVPCDHVLTLDKAIAHAEECADNTPCGSQHRQLADWLKELKTLKTSVSCGNAAKMREALRTLRQRFDNNVMAYQDRYFKFSGWHWHKKAAEAARWRDVFLELRKACDVALAAPPRNCDMPLVVDGPANNAADKAWIVFRSHNPEAYFDVPGLLKCINWLFAPAKKKE